MLGDVLRTALTAALAADSAALAATMAPDIGYWDAVSGPVTGAPAAAAALAALFAAAGAEVATGTVAVRTSDDVAAVAEVDTAATRLAVVALGTASGEQIGELRCYVDPAELHH